MDEFKYHVLIQQPYAYTQSGYQGGFTGTVMQTAGSSVFNLYTDPQESDSIGVRHIPMGVPLQTEMHAYMEILKNIHHARRLNLIKPALSLRSAFAGCDADASYPAYRTLQFIEFARIVGRIRRSRRIRQSTAGGRRFLLIHHHQMRLHNVAGRTTVRQQISHCFKIWR